MQIHKRGGKYWLWADCLLEAVGYQARGQQGSIIDVQARTSREGFTQLFIGVYNTAGHVVFEEFYSRLSADTVDEALNWAIRRCDVLVDRVVPFTAPHRLCAHLAGSDQTSSASGEFECTQRDAYLSASKEAFAQYVKAKTALVSIMRNPSADPQARREHAQRLHAALDAWASLPRRYANSTGGPLTKKTPQGASSSSSALLVEEFEHDRLGVGFAGI